LHPFVHFNRFASVKDISKARWQTRQWFAGN
jgi:hypothetical protein